MLRQAKYDKRKGAIKMQKKENSLPKQGIDGCTFNIESKWIHTPLINEVPLINSNGDVYGTLKQIGIDYVLFICPPKYVRKNNAIPFGISDFPYLEEMKEDIERFLKKQFPKGYYITSAKMEVNETDTMVGECQCENIFDLFCNSLLHEKDQNIFYVTQSKDCLIKRDVDSMVSRTVGNQWKLKCYNKTKMLEMEMNMELEDTSIRIEFILMTRKLHKLFGKKLSICNIFSQSGFMLLINEYKLLMDNLIDNYVKKYLSLVHKQLLEDLRRMESPTDVYCLWKENIHDKDQLKKVLKIWYKERDMNDNSNQVLQGLNKKFELPKDTFKTVKKFHYNC